MSARCIRQAWPTRCAPAEGPPFQGEGRATAIKFYSDPNSPLLTPIHPLRSSAGSSAMTARAVILS
jgi:hypothetical protein